MQIEMNTLQPLTHTSHVTLHQGQHVSLKIMRHSLFFYPFALKKHPAKVDN